MAILTGYKLKAFLMSSKTLKSSFSFNLAFCSMSNPEFQVLEDGKRYCFSSLGAHKLIKAQKMCRAANAKLPLPKSSKDSEYLKNVVQKLIKKDNSLIVEVRTYYPYGTYVQRTYNTSVKANTKINHFALDLRVHWSIFSFEI